MRLRALPIALLAVAACGGAAQSNLAPPPIAPCDEGDPVGCFEKRRAQCRAGKVWRLEISGLGTLQVAASGAMRLDHAEKQMFGADAKRWLSCMRCSHQRRCIPYLFPLSLSLDIERSGCEQRLRGAPPWQGRNSRILEYRCRGRNGTETTISIRLVPSLREVRDALVRAGAVAQKGQLSSIDGLVVSVDVGSRRAVAITRVAPSDCSRLLYPAGHHRVTASRHFAELPQMMTALRLELERAGKAVVDVMMAEAVRRAVLVVGRICPGGPPPYENNAISECVEKHPELRKSFAAAVNKAMADQLPRRKKTLERLRRTHIDAPLCEHFDGRVRSR